MAHEPTSTVRARRLRERRSRGVVMVASVEVGTAASFAAYNLVEAH